MNVFSYVFTAVVEACPPNIKDSLFSINQYSSDCRKGLLLLILFLCLLLADLYILKGGLSCHSRKTLGCSYL